MANPQISASSVRESFSSPHEAEPLALEARNGRA
jgi:hypothetical protein